MRKVGDVMKELGFNKDSSVETQKAFIKHLIKAAYGVDVRESDKVIPHQKPYSARATTNAQAKRPTKEQSSRKAKEHDGQLSFNFDEKEDESA